MSEFGNPKTQEGAREKRVKTPVTTNVKVKKKSDRPKLSDIFIAEDVSSVGSHLFEDVLVPAIKKVVSDIVRDGIDMMLYGSTQRNKKSSNVSYVSYNRMSDRRDEGRSYKDATSRNHMYNYNDITFYSRGEAEMVLTQLDEIIEAYGMARVADLYDAIQVTPDYTAYDYGWMNLSSAKVVNTRDGYKLDLPRAVLLK